MSETGKTAIFWLLAASVALWATIVAWPRASIDETAQPLIGKNLFEGFTDVLVVANLKIDRFDEELGQLGSFEVTRDKKSKQWSIPSHNGYPADATEQVRDAATAFLNLRILDIASEVKDDHEKFGVLEPNASSLKVGDEGVGRLVVLENDDGETLVNLIVGSTVKDNVEQRFVRIPTQDVTYVVKFDDKPLTTKFGDWIEDNLLKMNAFDVREVSIRDYSIVRTLQGATMQPNFDADVTVQDNGLWTLDKLAVYEKNKPVEQTIAEDEEINAKKLGALRSAMEKLKIVDVRRKPDGLSGDLKADASFMKDEVAMQSLIGKGFYPQQTDDGKGDVLAANGELIAKLKNGVEYLLRFGDIDRKSLELSSGEDAENEEDATGVNRYLLVSARLNESLFPEPELATIPQSWGELHPVTKAKEAPAEPKKESNSAESDANTNASKDELETTTKDPAETESSETKSSDKVPNTQESDEEAQSDPEAASESEVDNTSDKAIEGSDTPASDGASAESDVEQDEKASAEKEAVPDAAKSTEEEVDAKPEPVLTDEEKQEELEAAQEKVRKANQRLKDNRDEKIEEARRKVRSLNERFADWYYVVPESEYRKIHLSREDLLQKKVAEPANP